MRDETCYYLTACFHLIPANGFLPEIDKIKIKVILEDCFQ